MRKSAIQSSSFSAEPCLNLQAFSISGYTMYLLTETSIEVSTRYWCKLHFSEMTVLVNCLYPFSAKLLLAVRFTTIQGMSTSPSSPPREVGPLKVFALARKSARQWRGNLLAKQCAAQCLLKQWTHLCTAVAAAVRLSKLASSLVSKGGGDGSFALLTALLTVHDWRVRGGSERIAQLERDNRSACGCRRRTG